MTTGRKRWWRAAAITAVGGVAVTGSWFGLVRAKTPARPELPPEATDWSRTTAPAPTVSEVGRTADAEPAPPTGVVVPAGATLPPLPSVGSVAVAPAIPVASPVVVPAAPLMVPMLPVPPMPVQPVSGPRSLDAGLTGGDRSALPVVPALPTLPVVPPAALPALPTTPDAKPLAPMPAVSAPPAMPMLPAPPMPAAPAMLPLPAPTPLAPVVPSPVDPVSGFPPVKPADPVQPMNPAKPDSDLKPINPATTLNPTVAPAVPVMPPVPGVGREMPAMPVDRSKTPEPSFISPTDKYVFPVKPAKPVVPDPRVPTPRDDTMLNLTTTAAFAVLGGAMLAVEKANPPVIPPKAVVPSVTVPLKADDEEVKRLKTDLAAANRKIEDLEKQVKRLDALITGKKDELGILVNPKEPGAVDDVKAMKDKIAAMQKEIDSLKTQTALKPAVVPDVKPKGTVKVVNEYPVDISMVINDKSYRIAPGSKLDVEIPAGDFTYQLLQSGAAATKSVIKEKETVTLRIK